MRRKLTLIGRVLVVGLVGTAAAACSGSDAVETSTTISASVTQTAPSVWSPPESSSSTSTAPASTTNDPLASKPTPLPGLTSECTITIHAQAAVNGLFGQALEAASAATGHSGAPASPSDTDATSGDETDTTPPALTSSDVSSIFDKVTPQVPADTANAFATLKEAADRMTTEPAGAVADILAEEDVVAAMRLVSDYITSCTPATTE